MNIEGRGQNAKRKNRHRLRRFSQIEEGKMRIEDRSIARETISGLDKYDNAGLYFPAFIILSSMFAIQNSL
jgi:hypothetical protein